ncbi:cyclin-T2-like [Uloborus diversus]|uniref:cyclin-T2-like n=1 Tax=Uloborus diversus TaxID=327109 RepID=UPI0024092DFB|nr:cyclin-T2-like [Uloborus diversus]
MENAGKLYFTKEQLGNTPSRRCGIDANKELSYRQQAANFIQDMGQRLQVSQLCINTAIVYMHRFYAFHSFSEVHRNSLSVAALFLAAKVEEQPRKLEHVIKVAHVCLHKDAPPLDVRTDAYLEKQFEVVAHENVLLQTLGFILAIEHPHTYVVKVCQLVKASKDLAQTSYFMATTSLHMTTMCLQYKPTIVACVCIHLACKWSSWKIEPCSEGKEWYYYVDKSVTLELLETLTQEFIAILETSPHKFRRRFMAAQKEAANCMAKNASEDSNGPSKHHFENKIGVAKKDTSPGPSCLSFSLCPDMEDKAPPKREAADRPPSPPPAKKIKPEPTHSISLESYREKREKERLELKHSEANSSRPESRPQLPEVLSDSLGESPESPPLPDFEREPPSRPAPARKVNHQAKEAHLSATHHREDKPEHSSKNPVSDPVVVLERVRVKAEPREPDLPRGAHEDGTERRVPHVRAAEDSVQKTSADTLHTSKQHKHQKHKINSLTNSNGSGTHVAEPNPAERPKANGSEEPDPLEKKVRPPAPTEAPPKHERREKHKSKHSGRSSKDKSLNNHSEPIKVKIRKDHIIHLPENNGPEAGTPPEAQRAPGIKIKLKPPVAPEPPKPPNKALKIVITKDKGSYSTSHRNERESRKRAAHSPVRDSSHDAKHSRSRHSDARRHHHHPGAVPPPPNPPDFGGALYGRGFGGDQQAYYQPQYYPNAYEQYQVSLVPPPPPPPLPTKGGENPPLPPPLPPPPPPPQ